MQQRKMHPYASMSGFVRLVMSCCSSGLGDRVEIECMHDALGVGNELGSRWRRTIVSAIRRGPHSHAWTPCLVETYSKSSSSIVAPSSETPKNCRPGGIFPLLIGTETIVRPISEPMMLTIP